MQNEQGPAASSASTTTPSITSMTTCMVTTSSTGRPHISVYGGIPDRHTVQVIQQALQRQPSTAAQYLQQMYAAQQQHLMLQTAAFQQQQQQLQSLAAVQQASLVAGRQSSNQNAPSQQTGTTQTTINLTTPQAAAQLISRAQSVSSASTGIPQQAVLLGNTSSPALTASQAQMYLRAQMLIFTPTAAVAAVQSEALAQSTANQQSANAQVQSLAIHSQQGTPSSFLSQPHLQGLCLKQTPGGAQLSLPSAQLRNPTQQGAQPGGKAAPQEAPSEGGQTGEGPVELTARLVSVSRSVTAVSSHPLISPGTAYAQIQTHQLLQQHKQQQYVIQQQRQIQQQQSHLPQQTQAPVLHTTSLHTQAHMLQALAIQPHPQTRQGLVTVLPKPPVPIQQATIFHSTVSPQMLAHNVPSLTQHHNGPTQNWPTQTIEPNAKPLQLAAVNLQIQPTAPSSASQLTVVQDSTSKIPPLPGVVMETNSTSFVQQPSATPTREATTTEQCPSDPSNPTTHSQGKGDAEGLNAKPPGAGSAPVMTSGNGNNAPTVTGSTPQNGENKPPQAIVKPQILTHVIEGFVIQEGAEPFPVEHPSLLIEYPKKQKQHSYSDSEKQPQSNPCNTTDSDMDLSQQELKEQEEPTLSCELCGRVDFAYNFKRSKRFCSTVCAKRYNVGCTKRVGLFPNRTTLEKLKKQRASNGNHQSSSPEAKKQTPTAAQQPVGGSASSARHHSYPRQGESSHCSDMSSYEGPPSPLSAASSGALGLQTGRGPEHHEVPLFSQHHFLASNPAKWNVEDVYEFICSLPGCLEIAEEFRSQEIDGQALLLLKEDHLMATMNIKLGPALKIYAQISMLKDS